MKALGCGDMSPLLRWRKLFNLCFATCKLALPKVQTCLRTPNAISATQLIPDLNINDFICFQRLINRDAPDFDLRSGLAQGFLDQVMLSNRNTTTDDEHVIFDSAFDCIA